MLRLFLGCAVLVAACNRAPSQATDAPSTKAVQAEAVEAAAALAAPEGDSEIPALRGRVNDYANLLSSPEEAELSALYQSLEEEIGCQIGLLTVERMSGMTIEEFSRKVANTWGLGRRDIDDGLLITLAVEARSVRIEVGYGLELIISDDVAKQVVRLMGPELAAGNFFKGLSRGSTVLRCESSSPTTSSPKTADRAATATGSTRSSV